MSERVTITVESSLEHGDLLSVRDAMLQVLDFFDILTAAASDESRSHMEWRLVEASTNSPFTATAEAVSCDTEMPSVDLYAREAKARTQVAFECLARGDDLPSWVRDDTKGKIVRLLKRNLNGVGRTVARLVTDDAPVIVAERTARAALQNIERREAANQPADLSGEELGSVEAHVIEAATFNGRPALRIRDRVSGDKITCVLSDDLAAQTGDHKWSEVWSGQRVLAGGRIKRAVDGRVVHINADSLKVIQTRRANLPLLIQSGAAGALPPARHFDDMWDA